MSDEQKLKDLERRVASIETTLLFFALMALIVVILYAVMFSPK